MARMAANMRRRENGGYELRFYVDGKRYSVYGATTKECKEKEADRRKEIEAGLYAKNRNVTLDAYFIEWISEKEKTVRESTINKYRLTYKTHIGQAMGRRKVKDIERREIVKFQNDLIKKCAINTLGGIMGVFRQVLKSAVLDEIIIKNPCDGIKPPKAETERPAARDTIHRALTEREIQILLKYAKSSRYYNALRLMLNTGIRAGEACGLQWRDIDWKNNVIHIRRTTTRGRDGKFILGKAPKTKKSARDIPMNETIRGILRDEREKFEVTHGGSIVQNIAALVFAKRDGTPGNNLLISEAIRDAIKKAERHGEPVAHFSTHALRDTFASMAAAHGMPMNTLKEILGHSSYAMTCDLYCHVYEDEKKKAMAALKFAAM